MTLSGRRTIDRHSHVGIAEAINSWRLRSWHCATSVIGEKRPTTSGFGTSFAYRCAPLSDRTLTPIPTRFRKQRARTGRRNPIRKSLWSDHMALRRPAAASSNLRDYCGSTAAVLVVDGSAQPDSSRCRSQQTQSIHTYTFSARRERCSRRVPDACRGRPHRFATTSRRGIPAARPSTPG